MNNLVAFLARHCRSAAIAIAQSMVIGVSMPRISTVLEPSRVGSHETISAIRVIRLKRVVRVVGQNPYQLRADNRR